MRCQNCDHNNKPGHRYCSNCGAELSVSCPECGLANEPGDNFCGGCGRALSREADRDKGSCKETISADPDITIHGELRQVTILFADIAGYTKISSEKDPEEIHGLLSGFFEVADSAVQSYGGRIDKHIGDAVMGVFGAPVAHDNEPRPIFTSQ